MSHKSKNDLNEEDDELIFNCSKCKKNFSSESSLRVHIRKVHKGEEIVIVEEFQDSSNNFFNCEFCDKFYNSERSLQIHIGLVHKTEREPRPKETEKPLEENSEFKCQICSKVLNSARALNTHSGWHKRKSFGQGHVSHQLFHLKIDR